jgi:hypothetical protein
MQDIHRYNEKTSSINRVEFTILGNKEIKNMSVLDRNTPVYSSRTNMVSTVGYNEDIMRNSKLSFNTDKLSNFGSYEDRVSRPVQNRDYLPPVMGSIRRNKNLSSMNY